MGEGAFHSILLGDRFASTIYSLGSKLLRFLGVGIGPVFISCPSFLWSGLGRLSVEVFT